jgi:hypothetical protein
VKDVASDTVRGGIQDVTSGTVKKVLDTIFHHDDSPSPRLIPLLLWLCVWPALVAGPFFVRAAQCFFFARSALLEH